MEVRHFEGELHEKIAATVHVPLKAMAEEKEAVPATHRCGQQYVAEETARFPSAAAAWEVLYRKPPHRDRALQNTIASSGVGFHGASSRGANLESKTEHQVMAALAL